MPEIRLEHLGFVYRSKKTETRVFANLSHAFESDKIHVILGKSGCGKTTLLKCISGLADYEGHIYYDDIAVDGLSVGDRGLGYMSQEFGVYPHFDLFTSIAYPLKVAGAPADEIRKRVHEIAKEVGIDNILSRKPRQVSIGQLQRAALARSLIKHPNILLLDEPLSNVDEKTKHEISLLIREMAHKYGVTVVYICHDFREATRIGDMIHVMDEGKFILSAEPMNIVKSQDPAVISIIRGVSDETL